MTDLKACPFCGGEAKEWYDHTQQPMYQTHVIKCSGCHITKPNPESWNTRVKHADYMKLHDALQKIQNIQEGNESFQHDWEAINKIIEEVVSMKVPEI